MACRRFFVRERAALAACQLSWTAPCIISRVNLVSNRAAVTGVSGLAGGQRHVTPFFSSLFPLQFAPGGTRTEALDDCVVFRSLFSADSSTTASKSKVSARGVDASPRRPQLRPWHVIANLKHAVLLASNGEEKSERLKFAAGKGLTNKYPSSGFDELHGGVDNAQDEIVDLEGVAGEDHGARDSVEDQSVADSLTARLGRYYSRTVTVATSGPCLTSGTDWKTQDSNIQRKPLTLERALKSSAYAFHHTFEMLVRDKQERLAVELFRRWWCHNPHLFPIELELQSDCDELTASHRSMTEKHRVEGSHRRLIAERLLQTPAKKYFVSSALFGRVVMVALRLGDPVVEEFLLQELLYECVFTTVCGGRLTANDNPFHTHGPGFTKANDEHDDLPSSSDVSSMGSTQAANELRFDLYRERYEDWLVLVGALAAAAMLERHAGKFRREVSRGSAYERLVCTVRDEYAAFISKAFHFQQKRREHLHRPSTVTLSESQQTLPGWAKLLFTTVLRCYEESGVLHSSPARRPANTALLWKSLHDCLLEKFPHVFHAGNTVTTLLALEALEETSVSTMGTRRLSFAGKEDALCQWRLECLSCKCSPNANMAGSYDAKKIKDIDKSVEDSYSRPLGNLPRVSRQLRTHFVTAYSTLSGNGVKDEGAAACGTVSDSHELHWKHREFFGTGASLSFSRASIPVFATAEEVRRCRDDSMDEIFDVWCCAVDIFRSHSSLPLLKMRTPQLFSLGDEISQLNDNDVSMEVSKPSMFVLLRLVTLLASIGEPPHAVPHEEATHDLHFQLVECIEEDIIPFCHPSVASNLRRCCVTHLSRSGARGVRAMLARPRLLSERMNEDAAMERLLTGLLWSGGGSPLTDGSQCGHFSFGSGSLAWCLIAQQLSTIAPLDESPALDLVLSHLVTLSFAIPDDHRCMLYTSSCMNAICTGETGDVDDVVSTLRYELNLNPPPAVHLYISLLQLLAWVIEWQKTCAANTRHKKECSFPMVSENGEGEGEGDECSKGQLPSLRETAHHWSVVQRYLGSVSFAPPLLERIVLTLVYTCPDVELVLRSLLALVQQHHLNVKSTSTFDEKLVVCGERTESASLPTPRLLYGLCELLVRNGIRAGTVLKWRAQRGAPECNGACEVSLHKWHCAILEGLVQVNNRCREGLRGIEDCCDAVCNATKDYSVGVMEMKFQKEEAKQLLGSVVLDIISRGDKLLAIRENYNVTLFLDSMRVGSGSDCDSDAHDRDVRRATPRGVVLPSLQMTSAYPASSRQRVTGIKDALREMYPERRVRLRQALAPRNQPMKGEILAESMFPEMCSNEEVSYIVKLFT
uniref:Uncharacterized protein n=1 Tax=Trypanosoma congolense (strain IL3000) TaxID=1068625 RepID=G0UXS4_TRYCI|nr:conserved hypothetical protein [Trypanosoma congolense IL3000]